MAAMAYENFLVHIRPYGSIEPVELALRLGGRFGARVTGLYALQDVAYFRRILAEGSAPFTAPPARRSLTQNAKTCRAV
jgi:hypothetical protein